MRKTRPNLSIVLWVAVVLYFLVAVATIVYRSGPNGDYEGDFLMYYCTTKAYDAGINPYDLQAVESMSGQQLTQFYYLPLSLYLFRPFTWLPHNTARLIFLVVQCGLLTYVIFLWQRFFLRDATDPWFLIFCLLAFNTTIYLDLRAGNVAIIEQALLWTALYFFLKNRPLGFCGFLALAAVFKVVPLFFALLILLRKKDERIRFLIAFGCVIVAAVAIVTLTDRELVGYFLSNLPSILSLPSEQGIMNPSSLAFFKSVAISLSQLGWLSRPSLFQWSLYLCWIAAVALVSWKLLRKMDASDNGEVMWAINFMCVVFVLLSPRFKDYSYIILLAPTYFLLTRMRVVRPYHLGFVLCILSAQYVTLPGLRLVTAALWHYYPLALAFFVWVGHVIELHARNRPREMVSDP